MSDTNGRNGKGTSLERLFDAAFDRSSDDRLSRLLRDERAALVDIAMAVGKDLAQAKADKTAILDTLVGEVARGLELENENANLRGRVLELELEIDAKRQDLERMTTNAVEAERTIDALTDVPPAVVRKAAWTVGFKADEIAEDAQKDLGVAFLADVVYPNALDHMREAARQLEEHAVAIERANDGMRARG